MSLLTAIFCSNIEKERARHAFGMQHGEWHFGLSKKQQVVANGKSQKGMR